MVVQFLRTILISNVAHRLRLNGRVLGAVAREGVRALALGVLATPMRRQLRSRYLWLGVAIALLIAAPNIYWNFANGWPSLEFYSTRGEGILDASVRLALKIQILGMNPVNLLLWVPGLVFLLFSKEARPYRPLGIAFLVLFVGILLSGQRRGDRIVGIYPIVFAAGALVWDRWQPECPLPATSATCASSWPPRWRVT